MWLKLCLLLIYICILFLLSRLMEALSWCDPGHSGVLTRQFLDPMLQSVAKLKTLLEYRGVSYDGVVEKSELTTLVEASGPVTAEEVQSSSLDEGTVEETNFTSGAHFIEQVEDAKDSVWLVQVVMHSHHVKLVGYKHWINVKRKASRFGVRTGILDCSLDVRYCQRKKWKLPVLVLALPQHFEEKASVVIYNYSGFPKETAILKWIRDKIGDRIIHIKSPKEFLSDWQNISDNWLNPEIRTILYTQTSSAPLFFSALSVKFPGRVKFGLVLIKSKTELDAWSTRLGYRKDLHLPLCVVYSAEGRYIYGFKSGEHYSFTNMEIFFKFFYPCLNDIFILSFCIANIMSWLEFFITNCSIFRRFRQLFWCIFKYNMMVILLWLPIIGLFQMPYVDRIPLLFLKMQRYLTTSDFGSVLRGDFIFFINHPVYIYVSLFIYLSIVTIMCKRYRDVLETDENWFNFTQMQTLTHLRPNDLFEPVRTMGSFDVFRSGLSQTSLWLQPSIPSAYIQNLPTWRYIPIPISTRAAENSHKVEAAMKMAAEEGHDDTHPHPSDEISTENVRPVESTNDGDCEMKSPTLSQKCKCNYHKLHYSSIQEERAGANMNQPTCFPCDQPVNDQCLLSPHSTSTQSFPDSEMQQKGCCNLKAYNSESESQTTGSQDNQSDKCCNSSTLSSYGFPRGYIESHHCVICLDEYIQYTMLCGLPCGHVFHETCIISWLNLEKHFCPMCRWPSFKLPVENA